MFHPWLRSHPWSNTHFIKDSADWHWVKTLSYFSSFLRLKDTQSSWGDTDYLCLMGVYDSDLTSHCVQMSATLIRFPWWVCVPRSLQRSCVSNFSQWTFQKAAIVSCIRRHPVRSANEPLRCHLQGNILLIISQVHKHLLRQILLC